MLDGMDDGERKVRAGQSVRAPPCADVARRDPFVQVFRRLAAIAMPTEGPA